MALIYYDGLPKDAFDSACYLGLVAQNSLSKLASIVLYQVACIHQRGDYLCSYYTHNVGFWTKIDLPSATYCNMSEIHCAAYLGLHILVYHFDSLLAYNFGFILYHALGGL